MLIPLWDRPYNSRMPWVTYGLIGVNLGLFFYTFLGIGILDYIHDTIPRFGLVAAGLRPHMLVSHMFLHGGWGHVAGNMFFLGFFGVNLEKKLGGFLFLALYLASGLSAGCLQLAWVHLTGYGVDVPMVGASGAVFGVLGLYTTLLGDREVRLLVPRIRTSGFKYIPFGWTDTYLAAYWFGLVYFVGNVLDGLLIERLTGVAHWAHVGGFLGGAGLGIFLHRVVGFEGFPEEDGPSGPRFEDEDFEELGYIPEAAATGADRAGRTRPIHRRAGRAGVLRTPVREREAREGVQTRMMLPGVADLAVVLLYEGRIDEGVLAAARAAAGGDHGSRRGRWARMGVLNRTLRHGGARAVVDSLARSGHPAVAVPAMRLLPLPDPHLVARFEMGPEHLGLVDPEGRIEVFRPRRLLLLTAGRTEARPESPYFLDLFTDPPLSRWRVNRSNFDFRTAGLHRKRSDHERFGALIGQFLARYPDLPIATSALDLVRGRHPRGYTFHGIEELEHYNDWVLQILGLERQRDEATAGSGSRA